MSKKYLAGLGIIGIFSFCFVSMAQCEDPDLQVNGIFLDAKGNTALVNNEVVNEGDTIAGAKIVKITEEGVAFNYQGKEFLRRLTNRSSNQGQPLPSKAAYSAPASVSPGQGVHSAASQGGTSPVKTVYGMPTETSFPQGQNQEKEVNAEQAARNAERDRRVAEQEQEALARIKKMGGDW